MEEWILWLMIIIGSIVLLISFIIVAILIIKVDSNPYMDMVSKNKSISLYGEINENKFEDKSNSEWDSSYSYDVINKNNPVSYDNIE